MPAAIRFGKATVDDIASIRILLEQANMHYIPSPEMPGLTIENYFYAKDGEKLVGFSGYKITSAAEAKTELMVVNRTYRGLNIGFQLQAMRMEEMLTRGVRILTTNSDLPSTIAWYKKHFGYREIGKLKKLHEFGDPTIDEWTTLQSNLLDWSRALSRAA